MRTAARQALVLLALTLAASAAVHFWHPRAPRWREVEEPLRDDEVTVAEARRRWPGGVFWIDARPPAQFDKGHVPGAINISEQRLDAQIVEHLLELQDNRKPVVVYCDSSACQASRRIKEYLCERLPIEEFFVLRGGWKAWQEAREK